VNPDRAVDAWSALADGTRRAIVACLAEGPQAVGQLAAGLPVSRSAVSQHLKILKDAGLVSERPEGTRRIYRLNPTAVAALRDQLDTYLAASPRRLQGRRSRLDGGEPMTRTDASVVRREVVVDAPVARAFAVFTERFGDFKPAEHNLLASPIAETVFEPRVGGHIYDRAEDGSECRWARILAYEPPHRVVFSWDIGPQWQIETDPELTSEVEVRFVAEGDRRTRVELEHRHIDRHGPGWQALSEGVDGDEGWPLYLARYAALLEEGR
jgi:DNA-binding transcriptional ArsR family regulator/uncharacterized protein YndB with AHSA1/START domain